MTTTALPPEDRSLAELLADDPVALDEFLDGLTEKEAGRLRYSWEFNGRRKQLWPGRGQACGPAAGCDHDPGAWSTWAVIAGRGFGKTFVGAHATHDVAMSGKVERIHLIAPSPADYRDVMIEGESGIQAIAPKYERPSFRSTKRLLEWPNGTRALCFSAHDPEALRGPQCGFLWADEPGAWQYGEDTWDMAQMGLRLGDFPRQVFTTTPKPYQWIKDLIKAGETHLTHGTTYENMSNLPAAFRRTILRKYTGTTLGRQELLAELLDAVEGALWTQELLEHTRRWELGKTRPRCVVAVDPAVSANPDSDETGIITIAMDDEGHGYVVADDTQTKASPDTWTRAAIAAYYRHQADMIVGEVNNGGDLVEDAIRTRDRNVRVKQVRASRGKAVRAEPVVGLFEQNRAHMLGTHPKLEQQLTNWVPGEKQSIASPDRLDAMVWGFTELMVDTGNQVRIVA